MATSTPRIAPTSRSRQTAKEALAEETHSSVDEVAKVYDQEFSTLAADAKITQYLDVLAIKRVRMKLRGH